VGGEYLLLLRNIWTPSATIGTAAMLEMEKNVTMLNQLVIMSSMSKTEIIHTIHNIAEGSLL